MDYEKEYHNLINKITSLEVENKAMRDEIISLNNIINKNEDLVKEAKTLVFLKPEGHYSREFFTKFEESKTLINIEEFFENSYFNKLIEHSNSISINDNIITFLDNKKLGSIEDDRFSMFLKKVFLVLPFLISVYVRYGGFARLSAELSKYNFPGKHLINPR